MKCPHCDTELPPGVTECECLRTRTRVYGLPAEDTVGFDPPPLRPDWPDDKPVPLPPADRFEVDRELGRDGFGIVWLARRRAEEGEQVAIRRLIAANAGIELGIQRYFRNLSPLLQFEHPTIAPLLEIDQDEYGPYLVTEYVAGPSLAEEIQRRGRFDSAATARIGQELCRALHHSHSRAEPLAHGELDAANVILTAPGDVPRIIDFGLSRADSEAWTPVDDVFSLGALLYRMVTGRNPNEGILESEIPPELRGAIGTATAEAPEDRTFTMEKFRLALAACADAPAEAGTPGLCPACGRHSVGEYRYCPNTGEDLYRACPVCRCGDNPPTATSCVGCGCDIRAAAAARDGLRRGQKRLREREFERALDEFERVMELVCNDEPARRLCEEAKASRDQARALLGRRAKIRERLDRLIAAGEFATAGRMVRETIGKDPGFEPWQEYAKQIPKAEGTHLLDQARRRGEEWDLDGALGLARAAAAIDTPGRPAAERYRAHVERLRKEYQELEVQVLRSLDSGHYDDVVRLCDGAGRELAHHPRLVAWREGAGTRLAEFDDRLAKGREALKNSDWDAAIRWFSEAEEMSPADDGRGLKGVKEAKDRAFQEHLDRAVAKRKKRRWTEALHSVELARKIRPTNEQVGEMESSIRSARRKRRRRMITSSLAVVVLVGGWLSMDSIACWRVSQGDVGTAALLHQWFGKIMLSAPRVEAAIADYWVAESDRARPDDPRRVLKCLATASVYRPGEPTARPRCELLLELAAAAPEGEGRQAVLDARTARTIATDAGLADLAAKAETGLETCEENLKREMLAGFVRSDDSTPVSRTPEVRLLWKTPEEARIVAAVLVDGEREVPLQKDGTEFQHEHRFEAEGTKEWTLRIRNDLDLEATFAEPVRTTFDGTAPAIVAADGDGTDLVTNKRIFEFHFAVEDRSLSEGKFPLRSVQGRVDDGEFGDVVPGDSGTYSILVTIPAGRASADVTIRAVDAAGNPGEESFTFAWQAGGVTTRILRPDGVHRDPVRGAWCTKQEEVTLRAVTGCTLSDEVPLPYILVRRADGEAEEKIELRAEDLTSEAGETRVRIPLRLSPGDNVVQLFVTDTLRNVEKSEPVTVCLDREAPRILNLKPTAGEGELAVDGPDGVLHLLLGGPRPFKIEVEDASLPVQLIVNDRPLEKPEIPLASGDYEWTIRAIDALGHASDPVTVRFRCLALPASVRVADGRLVHVSEEERIELRYVPEGTVTPAGRTESVQIAAYLIARRKLTVEGGFTFEAAAKRAAALGLALPTEEEWLWAVRLDPAGTDDMFSGEPEWVNRTLDPAVAQARDERYPDGWRATCGGRFWKNSPSPKPWARNRAPQPIAARFVLRLK